jgi:hypothetical protein
MSTIRDDFVYTAYNRAYALTDYNNNMDKNVNLKDKLFLLINLLQKMKIKSNRVFK